MILRPKNLSLSGQNASDSDNRRHSLSWEGYAGTTRFFGLGVEDARNIQQAYENTRQCYYSGGSRRWHPGLEYVA